MAVRRNNSQPVRTIRVTNMPAAQMKNVPQRKVIPRRGGSQLDPSFPGQQNGASMQQVQSYIKQQVRRKGFRFSGGTAPVDQQITISGSAKFLYGIAWLGTSFGTFGMMINNEQVIETVDTGFFSFGQTEQDYYAINRPLSGSDDIKITITGDAAYTNRAFIVYYK